jgi:hypothetical protein
MGPKYVYIGILGQYETHVLVCADNIMLLGENINAIKNKADIRLQFSKCISLEINTDKTKYHATNKNSNKVII